MSDYTRPDLSTIALLTIDVQRDFLNGQPFEIAGTSEALPQMKLLVEAFRQARLPIVHVVRLYKPDGSNADLCRRQMIEDGASIVRPWTDGSQLASPLLPDAGTALQPELLLSGALQAFGANEWALYKPRWGAFFQTALQEHLNALGITSLAFCGCNFPNCPRTSIYEASERDFRILLVDDAISGLYGQGQAEMANIGVSLMCTRDLISAIRSSQSASRP
jgi:nicotinamidase-related amidase